MDLDCLGSLVLARRLFPGHRAAASSRIHPVARNLYNFFRSQLDLTPFDELQQRKLEELVIVDTRSLARVKEYLDGLEEPPASISVWDHHHADSSDIPGAVIHGRDVGANSTLLGLEVM